MHNIEEYLQNVKKVAITGHVSPDGDCLGSCLGLYNYIKDNFKDIEPVVYLQEGKDVFQYLSGFNEIRHDDDKEEYDLLVLLDISSKDRIAFCDKLLERTPKTLCIDHHLTNTGGFTWFYNEPGASSASEVLFGFFDKEKISKACATCLYTGIIHDSGVFQYSSTSEKTMQIAGYLMSRGVEFTRIIEETFYQKTFIENKVMGEILANSQLYLDGKVIAGYITRARRIELGVKSKELDSVVAQLRNTKGVDVALFLHQLDDGMYKASFRSKEIVDVSAITAKYDGGGHVRAAGCKFDGEPDAIIEKVLVDIKEQLDKLQDERNHKCI